MALTAIQRLEMVNEFRTRLRLASWVEVTREPDGPWLYRLGEDSQRELQPHPEEP